MRRAVSVPPVWFGMACAIGALASACVESVDIDPRETAAAPSAPVAEFDPGQRIVPLPNSLLIDPATGRVNVPASCGETPESGAARVRAALNQLDGFGTSKVNLVATLSEPVDPASLEGRVFLLRLAERGMPLESFEGPVPIDVVAGTSRRFAADCSSSAAVPNLTIRPRAPLEGSSTYGVLLWSGIETVSGVPFEPSATWALVRQGMAPVQFSQAGAEAPALTYNATPFDPADPEDLARLRGLDQLWRGHARLLGALDLVAPALVPDRPARREDMLLAWAFETQTLADPLDRAIPGSPAAELDAVPAALSVSPPLASGAGPLSVEQFFAGALPGVPCSALGCEAIGSIYAASALSEAPSFISPSYLAGDACDPLSPTATGAFDDPLAPQKVCDRALPLLAVVPAGPPGPLGYPTVVFAHGLGRSKEDLLAIAGALARNGIASVALDAVDHGVRAAQVRTDAASGCDGAGAGNLCVGALGPTCAPQCFAPILSADLAVTRDHLRQTMLDQLALERALGACSSAGACGALQVDPERLAYLGQSLGALIGGVSVAMSRGFQTAVLNVGAADWMQILTDTETDAIRCPLVDALIGSGVLEGEPWGGGANADATCLGEAWKTEPGFLEFAAAARWILDPVDAVNYAGQYADGAGGPTLLLAEVVGDPVVPNSATLTFGNLLGLEPAPAAIAASATPEPTPAVLGPGSRWIRYQGIDADAASLFPGNAYAHGSLLAPAAASATMGAQSGQLGTIRMQVDTLTYLLGQLGGAP